MAKDKVKKLKKKVLIQEMRIGQMGRELDELRSRIAKLEHKQNPWNPYTIHFDANTDFASLATDLGKRAAKQMMRSAR
ncbi:hypothetical protein HOT82_gp021 [Gordonia phage Ronaldo]|uniref:Uncharacterized protein n=3 Tax=Ronaldovirus TaxID=2733205 RepID=A0A6B9L852_9CAUD|nr:hypothetical protein HOT81_gp018 [Gordonia phage Fryberger]YP_009807717.1 hypothetical protein HOT82_gp021 [Gordonia phage Ronaldo]AXN53436.1 hypothetical protein SEA_FRYBERGER_18 [Gordonia phage Fryberger]AXN53583.1 hypothetical protein SEA_RONALDO_21 [Gordonia phage Ronaldo]QHB38137.1 hypothetical protein SEA_VOLT_20 [Gordonia phage Volt]